MCRNIKPLYNFNPPVTEDEIQAVALQFVRKVSGFSKPSQVNETAFNAAVDEIALATGRLLATLTTNAAPKDREQEAAKAKARSAKRFGSTAPAPSVTQLASEIEAIRREAGLDADEMLQSLRGERARFYQETSGDEGTATE